MTANSVATSRISAIGTIPAVSAAMASASRSVGITNQKIGSAHVRWGLDTTISSLNRISPSDGS